MVEGQLYRLPADVNALIAQHRAAVEEAQNVDDEILIFETLYLSDTPKPHNMAEIYQRYVVNGRRRKIDLAYLIAEQKEQLRIAAQEQEYRDLQKHCQCELQQAKLALACCRKPQSTHIVTVGGKRIAQFSVYSK